METPVPRNAMAQTAWPWRRTSSNGAPDARVGRLTPESVRAENPLCNFQVVLDTEHRDAEPCRLTMNLWMRKRLRDYGAR